MKEMLTLMTLLNKKLALWKDWHAIELVRSGQHK